MNTQTLEQMKQLRLYGMQRAFNSTMQSGNIDYTNDVSLLIYYNLNGMIGSTEK